MECTKHHFDVVGTVVDGLVKIEVRRILGFGTGHDFLVDHTILGAQCLVGGPFVTIDGTERIHFAGALRLGYEFPMRRSNAHSKSTTKPILARATYPQTFQPVFQAHRQTDTKAKTVYAANRRTISKPNGLELSTMYRGFNTTRPSNPMSQKALARLACPYQ